MSMDEIVDLDDQQIGDLLQNAEARIRRSQAVPGQLIDQFCLPSLETRIDPNSCTAIDASNGPRKLDASHVKASNLAARKVVSTTLASKNTAKENGNDSGAQWFNMPRTSLTPQFKRDYQLLQMRNVLDSHRHYKKGDSRGQIPEYSQVGTIIEGPAERFSARLQKKDRAKSLLAEFTRNGSTTEHLRNKYGSIQSSKTSGKRASYKAARAQRVKRLR